MKEEAQKPRPSGRGVVTDEESLAWATTELALRDAEDYAPDRWRTQTMFRDPVRKARCERRRRAGLSRSDADYWLWEAARAQGRRVA